MLAFKKQFNKRIYTNQLFSRTGCVQGQLNDNDLLFDTANSTR